MNICPSFCWSLPVNIDHYLSYISTDSTKLFLHKFFTEYVLSFFILFFLNINVVMTRIY